MDSGFSPSVIWGQQGIKKPVEREFDMVRLLDSQDEQNGFIRHGNVQCGTGSAGFHLAGLRQKAFFWFVVAEGYFASHADGYSSSYR